MIGIAMGVAGTGAAIEAAGLALMADALRRRIRARRGARRERRCRALSTSASKAARRGNMDTPHPAAPAGTPLLFAYPFRVFFLSTALLAVLVVPAWLLVLLGGFAPPLALPALLWHQ